MSRTDRPANCIAATLPGSGAIALGVAGIALTRDLLLRPART